MKTPTQEDRCPKFWKHKCSVFFFCIASCQCSCTAARATRTSNFICIKRLSVENNLWHFRCKETKVRLFLHGSQILAWLCCVFAWKWFHSAFLFISFPEIVEFTWNLFICTWNWPRPKTLDTCGCVRCCFCHHRWFWSLGSLNNTIHLFSNRTQPSPCPWEIEVTVHGMALCMWGSGGGVGWVTCPVLSAQGVCVSCSWGVIRRLPSRGWLWSTLMFYGVTLTETQKESVVRLWREKVFFHSRSARCRTAASHISCFPRQGFIQV